MTRSSIRVNLQDFPFRYLISEPIHAVNLFFIVLPSLRLFFTLCFHYFVFLRKPAEKRPLSSPTAIIIAQERIFDKRGKK